MDAEFYDVNGKVIDKIQIDLARGGKSYFYDNLDRSEIIELSQKDYNLKDEKGKTRAWLGIMTRPDFQDRSIRITNNSKKYTISFDNTGKNIEIFDEHNHKKLSPDADKKLFDEIVTDARNAYKEIITKHKKALRLRNELQLADSEFCRMH